MRKLKSGALAVGGWSLIVIGFLILLLPGPLGWPGIPPMALGALMLLASGRGAKRVFIDMAKQEPRMIGAFRRFLRRSSAKRFLKKKGHG
jgi:hypothetical protein